jgi:hypothetical protein
MFEWLTVDDEVEAMSQNGFATLGSHLTHQNPRRMVRHAALTVLRVCGTPAAAWSARCTQLVDEIAQSRDVLRRRLGEAVHFAWPYGSFADISVQAANAVFDAGFSSLASGVRGCHLAGGPPIPLQQLRILREHCEAQWPAAHTLYFLARSSAVASSERRFRSAVPGSRNT